MNKEHKSFLANLSFSVQRSAISGLSIFGYTHLLSAFLCRCSFRYHSSRLFLGRKSETASARSCQPWISTYCAGLVLQSKIAEVEWPCVSGGLWEVEAVDCASAFSPLPFDAGLCVSQVNSDCVAQRRSCCNGMLAYYYVPVYLYICSRPILAYYISLSKGKRDCDPENTIIFIAFSFKLCYSNLISLICIIEIYAHCFNIYLMRNS